MIDDSRGEWEAAVLASDLDLGLVKTCWAIRSFANKDGECFPSQSTLARVRNCTKKTITRHLKQLAQLGYIKRDKGEGRAGVGGTTDLLRLKIPESGDTMDDTASTGDCDTGLRESGDIHDDTASESGDADKAGTNADVSGDTKPESGDKCGPKRGHHDVPQTSNQFLNQTTSASGDARGCEQEEMMSTQDETRQQPKCNRSARQEPDWFEIGKLLHVRRGPNMSNAEYVAEAKRAYSEHRRARA